ncbi:aldehyde dehydrogenase family protein [Sphingomonas sp. QA11]|uniref:aldehyde dehydrogenase family protein n=1 Tax=Sphingomonas sp. QA11 TaxID=2950605 RepID=UPI00234BDA30|nr:aldehyde dehydrogenase family protein [Sphingomonas sp. QA11]WCM28610.1 aldehyde dehydrogenase family protein [Sphingomonas sp. QA11]
MTAIALENDLSRLPPAVRRWLDRKPAHFIDGAWHAASAAMTVADPSSGREIAEIGKGAAPEIDMAVSAARAALAAPEWRDAGPVAREALLHRLAALIEARADDLAVLDCIDNGMPLWLARAVNVGGTVDVFRYYAGWPTKLAGRTVEVSAPPGVGRFQGMTRREPVGVIAAIVPWNVPLMMAAWKLAPALAAGCTVVLKPSEEASLSALALAELIEEAGFPAGVVNVVTGLGREAGDALVRHPGIDKISFTGSTATGRAIAREAGSSLKKLTLELGGKSPTILFADADLDAAIMGAANAIFLNSGQVCVAGSRLYIEDKVYDQVVERLGAHIRSIPVGAGLSEGVFMGPLVSGRQRERVTAYLDAARAGGMGVEEAADYAGTSGFYVAPTLVTGAAHDDPITQEEIFGPVLGIYRFEGEDDLLDAANGTEFGLAASLWTRNVDRVHRLSSALQCGKVTVNAGGFPYPGLPEGGYKGSGFGRDLGPDAVEQCLQTKTLLVHIS